MLRSLQLLLGAICCSEFFIPRPQVADLPKEVKRNFTDPHFLSGHNGIVQLFEWKWLDIAKECEEFLGPRKFGGVQISPPNENIIIENRPWFERYQPISYKIASRSGSEKEFLEMTRRCNAVGVRIYADIVINHMAADQVKYIANGTGGSQAIPAVRNYPAVPYSIFNFHPTCAIVNYQDPYQVRNCELVGLHDLNQTIENTRDRIVEYLNHLIDLGVAGFRYDAAKHMWPKDLEIITNRVKNLNTIFGFGPNLDPFVYQEVIDNGNEPISKYEYTYACVTEFRFSSEIGKAFTGGDELRWLIGFGEKWDLLPSHLAVTFIDNHDSQRSGSNDILTYKRRKNYIMAQAFSLAHPYGIKRIMSSFSFNDNNQGPPADANGTIISPTIDKNGNCTNGWVCEHRWRAIASMVDFIDIVDGENVTSWWDNGKNQIAFSRGSKGFIVFNLDSDDMFNVPIETTMKSGIYCDIITGEKISDFECSGKKLEVDEDGIVIIDLDSDDENGVMAIHINQEIKNIKNFVNI
ncbi:hypothetical protein PVAND_004717 [Polypedilum vanderplanki]|uniref:Alpha-amylase n=1 Tax=Polypedilum vanderplanki TaxID=319348 RepID=A0A9J6BY19_POLVA|nr:hypothetical protein PVAND_004717 [Polypedilum vanderplanki]